MSSFHSNGKEKELNRRRGISDPAAASQSRPGRARSFVGSGSSDGNDGTVHGSLSDHSTKQGGTKGLEGTGDDDAGDTALGGQDEPSWNSEERIPDDPFAIEVQFPSSIGDDVETDLISFGQSLWFHMRQRKSDMEHLREKLNTEAVSFLEESLAPNKVTLKYDGKKLYFGAERKEKAKAVFNLFQEAAQYYIKVNIPGTERDQTCIFKEWPQTQLYKDRIATVHRTHSGHFLVVTNKENLKEVEAVIDTLLPGVTHPHYQHSDTHDLEFNQIADMPEGSITSDSVWETFEYSVGDTVIIKQETIVALAAPFLQFLQSKTEARDHVITFFKSLGIECKFDFDNKELILTTDTKPHDVDANKILEKCVNVTTVHFTAGKIHKFLTQEEFCRQLEENLPKLRGKFMLIPFTGEDYSQMLISTTNDITEVVLSFVKSIMDDVKDARIEVDEEDFHTILKENQREEHENWRVVMKEGHVAVKPIRTNTKFTFFLRGNTANISEFEKNVKYYFSKKRDKYSAYITVSGLKHTLLETKPEAVAYVIQSGLEKDFEYKVKGSSVQVSSSRNTHKQAVEYFSSLLKSETILLSDEPLFDMLTMDELNEMLMEKEKLHQNKLLIDFDKENGKFSLIGTDDIFPAIVEELEQIKVMYQRDEQNIPLTHRHMEYIYTTGNSDLLAITDDPRMKVTVIPFSEKNQPAVRVTGSKIGVTEVKEFLKCTAWKGNEITVKASEVECTLLQKEAFEEIPLFGLTQMLLKEISYARSYIKQAYAQTGYTFELDTNFKFVKFGVKKKEDLPAAKAYLSKCTETSVTDFKEHKWLNAQKAKCLLEQQVPDLTSKMIVYTNRARNTLMLIGTIDVAVPVIDVLHKILDEHKEECVAVSLTAEEASELHSDNGSKLKSLDHNEWPIRTDISSELLHITGCKVHVEKCFGSVCDMLLTLSMSKRANTSSQMRMCELDVSKQIYLALKENDNIWNFIAKELEERGFRCDIISMKLRLYAGSLSTLKKAVEYFPTLLFEKRFNVFSEPVVKMKGMKFVAEMMLKRPAYGNRLTVDVDKEKCILTVVYTKDIQNVIGAGLQEITNMYKEEELDTWECSLSDTDTGYIERELSNNEPTLKGKFKLSLEDGKLKILATVDCIKSLKMKIEHLVRWRQREAQINKSNKNCDLNLTEMELEFVQKEEVIGHIEKILKYIQFEIDRKAKVLRLYAIKEDLFDEGIQIFWSCLKHKRICLFDDPVLDNLTLTQFKDMLDVQHALHHGKLLVHIDDKNTCLELLCTDDVLRCVLEKVDEIKKKCSNVTRFIPCQPEKWVALETLYPEKLHQTAERSVRIDFNQNDGNIEVTGHRQSVDAAQHKLKEVMEKIVDVTRPLSGNASDVLLTKEGQSLIRNVQKNMGCAISLQESDKNVSQEMVDRKYLASLHLRLSPHTCVRLSQWTSKSGSSVTIIQGGLNGLVANTLAIPVVNGHLPAGMDNSLKTGNGHATLQKIRGLNINNRKVTLEKPDWCKCDTVEFYWMPSTIRTGKNQEKDMIRRTVKEILRCTETRTKGMSVSCVFMLESLWQDTSNLLSGGTKCVMRGCQEVFEAQKQSNFDVLLLTDETHSTSVMKILQMACPDSKKFSYFTGKVKKLRDKITSSSKESQVETIQPSIKVVVGQLQKQKVEVLVNSVDAKLDLERGIVSKALNDVSRKQLQEDCKKSYPKGIKYGEVAVTTASGGLTSRCKMVFHGALHDFRKRNDPQEPNEQKCWQVMQSFIYRCMHEAKKRNLTSIAFPVLGTGKLGYPIERVVQVMFNTVEWFFSDNPSSPVKMVLFVVFDTDVLIIKHFKVEQMARNYQANSFLNEGSSPGEARLDNEKNIMLQIIVNDIRLCQGSSDGLLCFWNQRQLSDPSTHPLVGEHLKAIQWDLYESDVRKNGFVRTNGEGLPASMLFHINVNTLAFIKAVRLGLVDAAHQNLRTVQIAILPQDLPDDPRAFVSDLLKILKEDDITRHNLCLVTVVVQDPTFFKSTVDCLSDASKSSGFWGFFTNMTSAIFNTPTTQSSQAGETSQNNDDILELVVTAATDLDCRKAHECLMKGIKEINQKRDSEDRQDTDSGTPVDKEAFYKERDEQKLAVDDQIFANCKVQLIPSIVSNKKWNELVESLSLQGMSATTVNEKRYIEGSFAGIIEAHKFLNNLKEKETSTSSGKTKKDEKLLPPSITVKQLHLDAVKYLFGEKRIDESCHIEPESDSQKKICFIVGPGNEGEVQDLKQRVEGVIQEELDLSNEPHPVTKEKAIAAAEAAMKDNHDVFIKYQEDKHTLMMFTEDWDKMAKAKKRVLLQFGQSKTTSRGRRRFAGSEKSEIVKSSDSRSDEKKTFIDNHGAAIAEGKHLTVKVYKTDITKLEVDAIVNAANEKLCHGGGVARAISSAAGVKLTQHGNQIVQRLGPIRVTELVVTQPGDLRCKMVFHAVGPEWHKYTDETCCLEDLCCTILRCLCEATNKSIVSLAVPSISSSIFAVPEEKCAQMYVRALKSFDAVVDGGSLRDIHFVDINDKMVSIIKKELETRWKMPCETSALAKDMAFIKDNLDTSTGTIVVIRDSVKVQNSTQKRELKHGRHQFSDKVSLHVSKDDILQQSADAIVSWEDFTFSTERNFIRQMLAAGGDDYRKVRERAYMKLNNIGDIEDQMARNLPQNNVIFAMVGKETKPAALQKVLREIFNRCKQKKFRSLIIPLFQLFVNVPGQNSITLFMESVADALLDLTQQEISQNLQILIMDNQQHVVDELNQRLYDYCLAKELLNSQETDASGDNQCTICIGTPVNPVTLKCGDVFCEDCIDEAFKNRKVCPNCQAVCGTIRGNMPIGTMAERRENKSLPGYEGCKTIVIYYNFGSGTQSAAHSHPGQGYRGTTRTAYLPDTAEGRKVLALLKVAWERRLTFTVGRSVTRGDSFDRVTWNEIHHKTNREGGPTNYGYPDADYLTRVQKELAAQGVTEADLGVTETCV